MKKLASPLALLIFFLFSCNGNAQVDLSKLTLAECSKDLDFLSQRINKSFAGFTPELKKRVQRRN